MNSYDPMELVDLINRIKAWGDNSLPVEKRIELLAILNSELASIKETNQIINQMSIRRSMGIKIAQA